MKRYANDEAQMNDIIRRYLHAKRNSQISRAHQRLMDQIETTAMKNAQTGVNAALIKKKAEKGNDQVHYPIPKHPSIESRWNHSITDIRKHVRNHVEKGLSEQMVGVFSFSNKEQSTNRLTELRAMDFKHELESHRDELSHKQHDLMEVIVKGQNSIPYEDFIEDRYGTQYLLRRDQSRKRYGLMVDRTQTTLRLIESLSITRKRKNSRVAENGGIGERKTSSNATSNKAISSSRSVRPSSVATSAKGSFVPSSPGGMSPSGSKGRQMLKGSGGSGSGSGTQRVPPPSPNVPSVPPRNRISSNQTVEDQQQRQQLDRERRLQQQEEMARKERLEREERKRREEREKRDDSGKDQNNDQVKQMDKVRNMSDEWDHFDSDDEEETKDELQHRPLERRSPITPPSDDDDLEEEGEQSEPPTREEMQLMFSRAGMSDRAARVATNKVFGFDDKIGWQLEDLTIAVNHEEGADFFLRVLNELDVPGIGNAHVREGIFQDKFWLTRKGNCAFINCIFET
jgi:hypothetical protein